MSDEKAESFTKSFLGCIGALALLPALFSVEGWIISLLWKWFLIPLGMIEISFLHSIGIALLANLLTHQMQPSAVKTEPLQDLGGVIGRWTMALLTAWIVHKLM